MSYYKDIYRDLPSRVYHIWREMRERPILHNGQDVSVTMMLMAAATGLAMPLEHLDRNSNRWRKHPAFQHVPQAEFSKLKNKFSDFLQKRIFEQKGLQDALFMHCQKLEDIKKSAKSRHGDACLDPQRHSNQFAIRVLRNALAHNNIADIPNASDQIKEIIFFSKSGIQTESDTGWHVIVISVESFREFLEEWFDLLKESDSMAQAAAAFHAVNSHVGS